MLSSLQMYLSRFAGWLLIMYFSYLVILDLIDVYEGHPLNLLELVNKLVQTEVEAVENIGVDNLSNFFNSIFADDVNLPVKETKKWTNMVNNEFSRILFGFWIPLLKSAYQRNFPESGKGLTEF